VCVLVTLTLTLTLTLARRCFACVKQPGKTAVLATPPVPVGMSIGESGRVRHPNTLPARGQVSPVRVGRLVCVVSLLCVCVCVCVCVRVL